jgi:dihydrofolate synthase / folylpolyglutamate synthase
VNYSEAIEYLYTRLPMYSRIGAAAYKKDITNTVLLCKELGDPQDKFNSVHIAGTNGKGSVSHMLASIFHAAGYKTGLYTSPHLRDFRERIRINGQMIPQEFVVEFVARTKELSEQIQPSFFELTVAMAFEYFASEQVDIAIIETGLGGRLDSTNIVQPVLSVITNIGYDHMYLLGNTLPEIASEKAGIIKPYVPVVIGETRPEIKEVFVAKASEAESPIFFAEEEYGIEEVVQTTDTITVTLWNEELNEEEELACDLPGIYQQKNIRTAITAVEVLNSEGYILHKKAIHQGLAKVKASTGLHGRWEVLRKSPLVVLDVAHNLDGIQQLKEQIELSVFNRLHIITGFVKDKDVEKILEQLPKSAIYYFTNAHIERAFPATELLEIAAKHHIEGRNYDDVNVAIEAALDNSDQEDMIVVCGSVFLVGEVDISKFALQADL